MNEFLIVSALMLASGGCGYYLGHRGAEGVRSDLNDAKAELEKAHAKLSKKKAT